MNTIFLRAPNSHQLSDDVIVSVAPRRVRSANQRQDSPLTTVSPLPQQYVIGCSRSVAINSTSSPGLPIAPKACNAAPTRKSPPIALATEDTTATASVSKRHPRGSNAQVSLNEIKAHRERGRLNMARLRKKQRDLISNLETCARELRNDIDKLHRRRYAILAGIPPERNFWRVCVEYFRLFRYGIGGSPCVQEEFMRDMVASDVESELRRGKEELIQTWCWLSSAFEKVELRLDCLEQFEDNALVATTTTRFTITNHTVCKVFPHLNSNASPLAIKLVGHRIVMSGRTYFGWDCAHGRLTRIISHCDLLTPVLHLVGSLESAARVFERSRVSPDFLLLSVA